MSQNKNSEKRYNISFGNMDENREANINIGLSGDADTLRGVQFELFSSVVRSEGHGLSNGIFTALTRKNFSGVQLSAINNMIGGKMSGVQASAISSIASRVSGVQAAGMNNVCVRNLKGLQLGGISNTAFGVEKGAQISGIMNVCANEMNGFQFAVFNYCDTIKGNQLGVVNICVSHPKGVQVGIVNYARTDSSANYNETEWEFPLRNKKIGLVNISNKTKIQMLLYGGNSTRINIAARFLNPKTYSVLGLGTHYMGLSKDFSGSAFYRTGLWIAPTQKTILSSDLGFYHIETFENADESTPERLYSLQGRVNFEYKVKSVFSLFFSCGYGMTRYYNQNEFYRKRFLFDAGIILF
ncbi:MAG: hypothetical protein IJ748_05875 [Bacteroidales bacterium]|nr:hypothetical protein [Bacteroidales bacterium]